MASTYKTPGAYVEEISKFPPSVAPVATAIPAFIGYTEKATKDLPGDLLKKPTRITAIAEYERYFGGPFLEENFSASVQDELDSNGLLRRTVTVAKPIVSDFLLYFSVRLYFSNGGGPCYIVSVDTYRDSGGAVNAIDADKLGKNASGTGGLDLIELEDEPTLLSIPDAQALTQAKYFDLCQAALAQCNKLQDRFSILDTKGLADTAPSLFRNFIGTNFLKYGAVYYPFLDTVYNYAYSETEVLINQVAASIFNLPTTTLTAINTEITKINNAITAITPTIDIVTPVTDVTTEPLLANKLTKLTPVKAAADAVKVQADLAIAALQVILAKANEFNTGFQDPDVTQRLNDIDSSLFSGYSNRLANLSAAIVAAPTTPGITEPEVDAIAETLIEIVSDPTPGAKDLVEDLNHLKTTLLPNLVTSIQENDPAGMIAQVNTGYSNANAARTDLQAIQTTNLVSSVTGAGVTDANAKIAIQGPVQTAIGTSITKIDALITAMQSIIDATKNAAQIVFLRSLFSSVKSVNTTELENTKTDITTVQTAIAGITGATTRAEMNQMATDFGTSMDQLTEDMKTIFITLENLRNAVAYLDINGKNLEEIENIDNNTYNQIKREIEKIPVTLPPSPAVAGIYAQTDRDRGVWKAPANVSLSSVIRPTLKVSNDIQDDLNVDAVAGKSINAIRAFTGKGTMIWGARTLAGNDNEWRYIPVRRFFNFAEESIKKASENFVFEPNDANTWVKVKAMIENFLTVQWRAGALAGAKTSDAFYVKIGLGETMTSLDILEGRMVVEVGMAVVRPAEFIVLKFSHKMQES